MDDGEGFLPAATLPAQCANEPGTGCRALRADAWFAASLLGGEARFLAWDAGEFLTGQTIHVDGGFSVTLGRRFGDGLTRYTRLLLL